MPVNGRLCCEGGAHTGRRRAGGAAASWGDPQTPAGV